MSKNTVFDAIENFFSAIRKGTKCPNCGNKKKEGSMVCCKCEKSSQTLVRELKDGITVKYADGTTQTYGTKNPRKSSTSGNKL